MLSREQLEWVYESYNRIVNKEADNYIISLDDGKIQVYACGSVIRVDIKNKETTERGK